MRKLLLLGILFAASSAWGISFKNYYQCAGALPTNVSTCTFPAIPLVAGDTMIFVVWNTQANPGSIADTCNNTWSHPSTQGFSIGVWTATANATATCTPTYTRSSNSTYASAIAVYSGVGSIGTITQGTASSNTSCSITATAGNAGNFIVSPIIISSGTQANYSFAVNPSGQVGTLRGTAANGVTSTTVYTVGIIDNVATAAAQPVTTTFNYTSLITAACIGKAIELKVPGSTTQTAVLTDTSKTMLLGTAGNMSYLLPSTQLADNFCTWVMPTGPSANTYQIQVQTGSQLNGQTSPITMPPWQMSRVCRDISGNYWANPPLVAGAGIYITPSPTGVSVSTSPPAFGALGARRAAMARIPLIAEGIVHLGGTAIAGGACSRRVSAKALKVLDSDVIDHSWPDLGSGTAYLEIWAFAEKGEVNFEVCNAATHAVTPRKAEVKWQVRR